MNTPSKYLLLSIVSAGVIALCFTPHHSQLDVVPTPAVVPKQSATVLPTINHGESQPASGPVLDEQMSEVSYSAEPLQPATLFSEAEASLEPLATGFFNATTALLPIFAAIVALFTGAFLRRTTDNKNSLKLAPMDMAADEDTPLTRRGVLTALAAAPFAAAAPAFAARSGGRMGGSAFAARKAAKPPPTTSTPPPASGPTNVYVSPPPVYAGPGYGYAPMSPFGFGISRGELLALSALELGQAFVREQQRQAFIQQQLETQRKLGRDEAAIQGLQQQLAEQEARMRDMQKVMMERGVSAPAS